MSHFLDDLSVGVLLLAAFGYAAYALGPKVFRARVLTSVARLFESVPPSFGLHTVGARLAASAARKSQAACGGCDTCESAAPSAAPTATAGPSEVRVPVATIRKRR